MADVVIPGKQAVREHEHLLKVLRSGGQKVRAKEAVGQAKELKEYRETAKRKSNRLDIRK
jgi:hypothetical protein